MNPHSIASGKLLIAMLGRSRGDRFVAAAKASGALGGTIAHGRAFAGNRLLQALHLSDVPQDIVFILLRGEAPAVIEGVCRACRELPGKLGGTAIVLDVAGMLIRTKAADGAVENERSELMESGYVLLTAIVNTGCADDVMAAARKAGARGGTILTARGTGTEEDVRFFGITLVPEKEILLIVTEKDGMESILDAVRAVPVLREPGGGVVYAQGVERFIVLGQ